MTDVSTTLTTFAAGLVAAVVVALAAGGLFWLVCRLVDAVAGRSPRVGYPKALAAAALVLLAQAAAGGAVVAPATAFGKVDWTTVGPGLLAAAGLAAGAAVLAGVTVCGLFLPARAGRALAVGLLFGGLTWAVAGGLLAARMLLAA